MSVRRLNADLLARGRGGGGGSAAAGRPDDVGEGVVDPRVGGAGDGDHGGEARRVASLECNLTGKNECVFPYYIKSSSVIVNSTGASIFIRYNREGFFAIKRPNNFSKFVVL